MSDEDSGARLLRTLAALVGNVLLLPTMFFIAVALHEGMGFAETGAALIEQYSAERTNLLVVSLLGVAPILVLCVLLGLRRLLRKTWAGAREYVIWAAAPIFLVTFYVQLSYWPRFLPSRQFMGFPHGLEFVIGPLIFAPIGVVLAWIALWLVRRSRP
jgi:hypothetical protein